MIYILGAGSMGCLWAAHLHQAYPDQVQFLSTRPSNQTQLDFVLETAFESRHELELSIPITSINDVSHIDTLLVCTKSYDALPAVIASKDKLSSQSKVVLFQNGLGSQFDVLAALENIPVYAAVTTEGANRQSDHRVVHAGSGQTYLGPLNEQAKAEISLVDQFSLTSLTVISEDDIWSRLWLKLAINCAINPFTALLNCANGNVKSSELFADHWPSLLNELTNMLDAAGYHTSPSTLEKSIFEVMSKTSKNISSMLQDIRQHKPTEIDDINGFAQRYLKEKELSYETNKKLSEAVKQISR